MQAGSLDRRVILLRRSLMARNRHGEEVAEYNEYATVWAKKLDVTGREYFTAQREIAEGTARFLIRYRSDVSVTDRVTCDSHTYDVKQIAEIGRRDGLELVAVMRDT